MTRSGRTRERTGRAGTPIDARAGPPLRMRRLAPRWHRPKESCIRRALRRAGLAARRTSLQRLLGSGTVADRIVVGSKGLSREFVNARRRQAAMAAVAS